MKELGYGSDYVYDHGTEDQFSGQDYFPEKMARQQFYEPKGDGFEREITKRLERWQKMRDDLAQKKHATLRKKSKGDT